MSSFQIGWFYFMSRIGADLNVPLAFELGEFGAGWLAAEEHEALVNGWL